MTLQIYIIGLSNENSPPAIQVNQEGNEKNKPYFKQPFKEDYI